MSIFLDITLLCKKTIRKYFIKKSYGSFKLQILVNDFDSVQLVITYS